MFLKKLICKILGHRSICLYRYITPNHSEVTAWKCERCGYTIYEQWDI